MASSVGGFPDPGGPSGIQRQEAEQREEGPTVNPPEQLDAPRIPGLPPGHVPPPPPQERVPPPPVVETIVGAEEDVVIDIAPEQEQPEQPRQQRRMSLEELAFRYISAAVGGSLAGAGAGGGIAGLPGAAIGVVAGMVGGPVGYHLVQGRHIAVMEEREIHDHEGLELDPLENAGRIIVDVPPDQVTNLKTAKDIKLPEDYDSICKFYAGLDVKGELPEDFQNCITFEPQLKEGDLPHLLPGDSRTHLDKGTIEGLMKERKSSVFPHPLTRVLVDARECHFDQEFFDEVCNYARMNMHGLINREALENANDLQPHYNKLLSKVEELGTVVLNDEQAQFYGVKPGPYPPDGKKHAEVYDKCLQEKFDAAFAELEKIRLKA